MKRSFKIAMVAACPFPYPRGTPIRIYRMAEALSQRGHEVHVVTYHLGELAKEVPFRIHRIPDVKTYRKYSPGPTYQKLVILDSLLAIKLFRVLRTHEIDLIHAHHYEGLLVSSYVSKWTKHPLVYDAHTLLDSELPAYDIGLPKKISRVMGRYLDRWVPKRAAHIITVTDKIRTKLIEDSGIAPDDITVVTNGVEYQHFDSMSDKSNVLPNGRKTFVFTGNFAAYQRIDLLLKIFREVLDQRQDVRLLLISDYSFDHYEQLAKTLKIREYIDIVRSDFYNLPRLLANADIALNPRTDCDGLPQKLLNYMAAGRPIVSFEGSAINLEHRKTGLVVENGNIYAFAKAILLLLEDSTLTQILGENAKRHVSSEYTWKETALKTELIYEHILGNKLK
jgi:glycosyltransferase involved in cell wall biosynthesis